MVDLFESLGVVDVGIFGVAAFGLVACKFDWGFEVSRALSNSFFWIKGATRPPPITDFSTSELRTRKSRSLVRKTNQYGYITLAWNS